MSSNISSSGIDSHASVQSGERKKKKKKSEEGGGGGWFGWIRVGSGSSLDDHAGSQLDSTDGTGSDWGWGNLLWGQKEVAQPEMDCCVKVKCCCYGSMCTLAVIGVLIMVKWAVF